MSTIYAIGYDLEQKEEEYLYVSRYDEPLAIEKIMLQGLPFQVDINVDGCSYHKQFEIFKSMDMMRDAITYRFKTFLASRKSNKTLSQAIPFSIPITYYMRPASRFQAFKLALFPQWLLKKIPVKYAKEDIFEERKLQCVTEFDLTAIYPDIEIPDHSAYVEIAVLKNDVMVKPRDYIWVKEV